MSKQFRTQLANMYSLMERMNKHYTSYDAQRVNEYFLDEGISPLYNQAVKNKLQPQIRLSVAVDYGSQNKELQVHIQGLSKQSVEAVQKNCSHLGDIVCRVDGSIGTIDISEPINFQEKKKRKQQATDDSQGNSVPQDLDVDGFDIDSELDKLNEEDDFDIDSMLDQIEKGDGGSNDNLTDDSQSAANASSDTLKQNDEKVWNWLNSTYKQIIDTAMADGRINVYWKQSVDVLYDLDAIFQEYLAKKNTPDEAKIYNDKTELEIKDEITKALKSGNYGEFANSITPLDIDAVIWGNQLSARNASAILKQGLGYGFTPTMVLGSSKWSRYFNRKLKPGARPFFYAGNWNGGGGKHKDGGSKQDVEDYGVGYQPGHVVGYDISDTEIADPNAEDFYNTTPGISNNLLGQKNQAALDYINKIKSQIPEDLLQKAESTSTDGGKARIYNEVLISYAKEKSLQVQLQPIDSNSDENTALTTYIRNIYAFCEEIITKQFNYANPANAQRVVDMFAFCIAYYTVGADRVRQSDKSYSTNIQSTWTEEADSLVSSIRIIFHYIKTYIKSAFMPLRDEINKIFKAETGRNLSNVDAEDNDKDETQVKSAANAVNSGAVNFDNSSAVNEGIYKNIENLLSNF